MFHIFRLSADKLLVWWIGHILQTNKFNREGNIPFSPLNADICLPAQHGRNCGPGDRDDCHDDCGGGRQYAGHYWWVGSSIVPSQVLLLLFHFLFPTTHFCLSFHGFPVSESFILLFLLSFDLSSSTVFFHFFTPPNVATFAAVATEHSLSSVQNWLIASLAFADLR